MPAVGWVLIALALVIAVVVGMVVGPYNRLVRLRNTLQESWRQVDVELNRRYDLIPNLVETVKAYAQHERGTLEEIVRLRNEATSASAVAPAPTTSASPEGADAQRAQVESQLSQQIGRLMVTMEAYPQLQANATFVELQRQLADTEDRIAAGRRFYNANVRAYNTAIESMPTNMVANAFHFQPATYFEVTDSAARQAPVISFGDDQQAAGSINPAAPDNPAALGTASGGPAQLPAQGSGLQAPDVQQAAQPTVQWGTPQAGQPATEPVRRPDQGI